MNLGSRVRGQGIRSKVKNLGLRIEGLLFGFDSLGLRV
jgi:hypothetical protein